MNLIGEVCNSLEIDLLTSFVGNHWATADSEWTGPRKKGGNYKQFFVCLHRVEMQLLAACGTELSNLYELIVIYIPLIEALQSISSSRINVLECSAQNTYNITQVEQFMGRTGKFRNRASVTLVQKWHCGLWHSMFCYDMIWYLLYAMKDLIE